MVCHVKLSLKPTDKVLVKVPKLLQKQTLFNGLVGLIASVTAYGAWSIGKPVYLEYQSSFAAKEFKEYGVIGTYKRHFSFFAGGMHKLSVLEQENEELQNRVAELEKKTTLNETAQVERNLASLNERLELKLKEDTGSNAARIPQGMTYEVPEHLTHQQLYTLGLGYFRKQEYEKSALIFTYLLNLQDDKVFERAENYLISGISWFHLKDYNRASKLVAEAQKHSLKANPIHREAILWQAMVEKALGKEKLAQSTLLSFVGQYPHSEEGQMINGSRKPAHAVAREVAAQHLNPYDAVIAHAKLREQSEAHSAAPKVEKESEHHEVNQHAHE
ncbi:MAG: hypothetical protein H7333_01835 [Bdellovibrionales bacterium]|nr:hypothetical protein [Oligoflexia bacterium]